MSITTTVSKIELLSKLKAGLITFLDELYDQFRTEPDLLIFRIFVENQVPIEDIMKYIIKNLCPFEAMVKAKNEKFFLENNPLFEKFDDNKSRKVSHFKTLWMSDTLTAEDRDVIWDWFRSFIQLGNEYERLFRLS